MRGMRCRCTTGRSSLPRPEADSQVEGHRQDAGEIVVSRRLIGVFEQHGITGASFHPVRMNGAKARSFDVDAFRSAVSHHLRELGGSR